MSNNKYVADFNRPIKKIKNYPDLRQNFSVEGIGRSDRGKQGKTDLHYTLGSYLRGHWTFKKIGSTPTAVNIYNSTHNGTLTGVSNIEYESDNPFNVVNGPHLERPRTATFNDSSTVYLVDDGSGVGNAEYTPSSSTSLGFAVQAWVKRTANSSNDDTILSLARNNGNLATQTKLVYRLYFEDSSDKLTLKLFEGSAAQTGDFIQEQMNVAWPHDSTWAHILVYVDQTRTSPSNPNIIFYVNGIRQSSTTTLTSFGGLTLPSPLPPLTIGAQRQVNGSGVFTSNSLFFKGELAEIAFWKDIPQGSRLITENTAAALYWARNGYYSSKSGFLSEPPRLELRRLDSATGSHPTIKRTGDRTRTGKYSVSFDDTKTVIFATASAAYPQVLNSDSPNFIFPTGTLGTVTRNLRKGVSDVRVEFTPGESLGPFDDSLIQISDSSFYLTGTSRETVEGFSSPLKSKTQIFFDITPSETLTLTRAPNQRFKQLDTSATSKPDRTGFAYWNAGDRRWEQIGLKDPATKKNTKFDYAVYGLTSSAETIQSGTNLYPQQFVPCQHAQFTSAQVSLTGSDKKLFRKRFYSKIGSPTITSFAPFKTVYHATSSQTISMSDYISHPFLLEKVVVSIQGRAQRVHQRAKEGAALRHQDDYMFFIYRQERRNESGSFRGGGIKAPGGGQSLVNQGDTPSNNFIKDKPFDVSGSQRFLVCSGAMTFYNSTCYTSDATPVKYEYLPINTPAFSHDFNITSTSNYQVGAFTGSINLQITPAVASQGFKGMTYMFDSVPPTTTGLDYMRTIHHYWPGGTALKPFMHDGTRDSSDYNNLKPSPYTGKAGKIDCSYGEFTFNQYQGTQSPSERRFPTGSEAARNLDIRENDPRAMRQFGSTHLSQTSFGSLSLAASGSALRVDRSHSTVSPYLIFPEDEIVLGLEAAIAPGLIPSMSGSGNSGGGFGGQCSLTGSHLELFSSDERQTVVLYGSLILDKTEYHTTLNQPLSSPAIHEMIYEPIVDQWDIETESSCAGTYVDNYITGTMVASDYPHNSRDNEVSKNLNSVVRGVAGSFIMGTAPNRAGAFQRSVTLFDNSERFYDTLMPNLDDYGKRIDGFEKLQRTGSNQTIVFSPSNFYIESDGNRMPFPYEGNPSRRVSDLTNLQIFGIVSTSPNVYGSGYLHAKTRQGDIRRLLFMIGFEGGTVETFRTFSKTAGVTTTTTNTFSHAHPQSTGAMGFRYGIQNIYPESPRAVFRRDRYGQFRDMLEQRREGRFFEPFLSDSLVMGLEGKNRTKVSDPAVLCKFTLSSSNQETDPYSTSCSNLSFAATSSLPYFDGQVRNNLVPSDFRTVALVSAPDLGSTIKFTR